MQVIADLSRENSKVLRIFTSGRYAEIIWFKAYAELRSEAARSYLGILWWILEPLFYMMVFYTVFALLRQQSGTDYVAFLLTGLVVWKWFATTLLHGASSIVANAGLMRQVYLPKYIFPCIPIITGFAKFLIVFFLLALFLAILGFPATPIWFALPALMAVQILLLLALGSLLGAVVPLVPDLRVILDNGIILLFFLSGIFFDINDIEQPAREYLLLNPAAIMIDSFRDVLLRGQWPEWHRVIGLTLFSLVVLLIARLVLKHLDRRYPKLALS